MPGQETTRLEATQVSEGALLSDAKLTMNGRDAYFRIGLSGREHMDWLWYLREALEALGLEALEGHPKIARATSRGKEYDYCDLCTRTSPLLTSQHRRWYPDGLKRIPPDFYFTPISLANAFMGDGSTSYGKAPQDNWVFLRLYTYSFSRQDNSMLQGLLESMGIIGIRVKPWGSNGLTYLETVDRTAVNIFFDLVEPYILSSYRYKIKRPWLKQMTIDSKRLRGKFIWRNNNWIKEAEVGRTGNCDN